MMSIEQFPGNVWRERKRKCMGNLENKVNRHPYYTFKIFTEEP